MRKYIYVQQYGTVIEATDPSVLDWIFDEIKKYVPSCTASVEYYDITGARTFFNLGRMQRKEQEVARWVTRLLCNNGYEPFAIGNNGAMHFRRMIEE